MGKQNFVQNFNIKNSPLVNRKKNSKNFKKLTSSLKNAGPKSPAKNKYFPVKNI